jgi:hypothetical protein
MVEPSWTRKTLQTEADARRMARDDVKMLDAVVLAFARFQGATHEAGVDRQASKIQLDRMLDGLEERPEIWSSLKELIGLTDDKLLAELVRYNLQRSMDHTNAMLRDAQAVSDKGAAAVPTPAPTPAPARPPLPPSPSLPTAVPSAGLARVRKRHRDR